jgi:hypothetical protein
VQEIDIPAAKRAFCGPGRTIRASVIDDLEAQIEGAKAAGNSAAKKSLKQRCGGLPIYLSTFR